MYKVRFNLGKGKNYRKWQVKNMDTGQVDHFDPEEVSLIMHKCFLRNQKKGAEKIFKGHNKYVVAWIECKTVTVFNNLEFEGSSELQYNPRVLPYWSLSGVNVDNQYFKCIGTQGRKVLTIKNQEYSDSTLAFGMAVMASKGVFPSKPTPEKLSIAFPSLLDELRQL